jgi:hypothetical protein
VLIATGGIVFALVATGAFTRMRIAVLRPAVK